MVDETPRERKSLERLPTPEKGKNSDSLSGLVMHALHLTVPDLITQLKKEWLANLPPNVPKADAKDQSFVWIKPRVGAPANDHFVQIVLPWMLIATADAYGAGNYFERTHAILWMEQALYQEICNTR